MFYHKLRGHKYDVYTGQKTNEAVYDIVVMCDFCGQLLEEDSDLYSSKFLYYKVIETGDLEQQYYYETLMYEDKQVDVYDVFNRHDEFYYCRDENFLDGCENRLVRWAAKHQWDTIYWPMYQARLTLLQEFFDKGKYTPEDFRLDYE